MDSSVNWEEILGTLINARKACQNDQIRSNLSSFSFNFTMDGESESSNQLTSTPTAYSRSHPNISKNVSSKNNSSSQPLLLSTTKPTPLRLNQTLINQSNISNHSKTLTISSSKKSLNNLSLKTESITKLNQSLPNKRKADVFVTNQSKIFKKIRPSMPLISKNLNNSYQRNLNDLALSCLQNSPFNSPCTPNVIKNLEKQTSYFCLTKTVNSYYCASMLPDDTNEIEICRKASISRLPDNTFMNMIDNNLADKSCLTTTIVPIDDENEEIIDEQNHDVEIETNDIIEKENIDEFMENSFEEENNDEELIGENIIEVDNLNEYVSEAETDEHFNESYFDVSESSNHRKDIEICEPEIKSKSLNDEISRQESESSKGIHESKTDLDKSKNELEGSKIEFKTSAIENVCQSADVLNQSLGKEKSIKESRRSSKKDSLRLSFALQAEENRNEKCTADEFDADVLSVEKNVRDQRMPNDRVTEQKSSLPEIIQASLDKSPSRKGKKSLVPYLIDSLTDSLVSNELSQNGDANFDSSIKQQRLNNISVMRDNSVKNSPFASNRLKLVNASQQTSLVVDDSLKSYPAKSYLLNKKSSSIYNLDDESVEDFDPGKNQADSHSSSRNMVSVDVSSNFSRNLLSSTQCERSESIDSSRNSISSTQCERSESIDSSRNSISSTQCERSESIDSSRNSISSTQCERSESIDSSRNSICSTQCEKSIQPDSFRSRSTNSSRSNCSIRSNMSRTDSFEQREQDALKEMAEIEQSFRQLNPVLSDDDEYNDDDDQNHLDNRPIVAYSDDSDIEQNNNEVNSIKSNRNYDSSPEVIIKRKKINYNKKTIKDLKIENFSKALRRSDRHRIKPLDYWRGQRPIYKFDNQNVNGSVVHFPTLIGVLQGTDLRVKRRSRKVNRKFDDKNPKQCISGANRMEDILNLSIHSKKFKTAQFEEENKFVKTLAGLSFKASDKSKGIHTAIVDKGDKGRAFGMIKFEPYAKKKTGKNGDYATHFTVLYGVLILKVKSEHETLIKTGSYFKINPSSEYSIKNIRNDEALLQFSVIKQ
ncbi:hypothetical protein SSS_05627 [Sarcoptes scabiei]|uniref:Mif2/CENP-C cupin domain-containing protein n=1 Tax=Sarcoptes scabiei TaxID=52283 RepID=A0A834RBU7_SARSC|nr:hypothetical protein SSS_05627 [Sarcoptes scabiei]